jgi:2-methylcitrate dehydratase
MAGKIPQTQRIAQFALSRTFQELSPETIDQLKKHLLDSLGSLLHCIERPTIKKLSRQIAGMGNTGKCPVPSIGRIPYDRAAQFFTALIRYPDFMDNYLGKEATCHPSDNIGSLLAAGHMMKATGEEFLTAMAISYEIECRLIEEIPVMMKGFDHTLLLGYSLTAGLSRMLGLTETQTANALGIAGGSFNPLVTCRASYTREWKGLMSSFIALGVMNIVLLAREDVTGPTWLFEGEKGFNREIGMELTYNWEEDKFDLISKCILKNYNAEVHTQSLIETALELKEQHKIRASEIDQVDVTTFLTTYHIVGGGEYGDRTRVNSKEQADHSLPYVIAVALLDGKVDPAQLLESRINKDDVQQLLRKVQVHTKFPIHEPKKVVGLIDPYTKAYPDKMMGEVKIVLKDGREFKMEKEDYYGFHTRPLSWPDVKKKFKKLSEKNAGSELQQQIMDTVDNFEHESVGDLIRLLSKAGSNHVTGTRGYKKAG